MRILMLTLTTDTPTMVAFTSAAAGVVGEAGVVVGAMDIMVDTVMAATMAAGSHVAVDSTVVDSTVAADFMVAVDTGN